MKKSIICIIVLLVAGIACCVAAFGMGIGEVSFDDVSAPRFFKYQEQATDKELEPHAEINRLILDIDAAECVVQTGDANSLTAGKDVTWKLEGETLTVSQNRRDGWWWKSKPAPITLTIRKDGLSDLDIDVDAGAVTVSDLTVTQRITCNVDAGAVEMTDVFAGNLELDTDAGSIAYSGTLVGPAKLECDVGSIDLTLQEGSTIGRVRGSVDAGEIDVTVNGKEALSQDGFSETVSANLPGAIGHDVLTFDCDVGSISVDLTA